MAIVKTEQTKTNAGPATVVYSSATTNDGAIEEIEQYCSEHGLTRAQEINLAYGNHETHGQLYRATCA